MIRCDCLECADGVLIDGHCFKARTIDLALANGGVLKDLIVQDLHECPASRLADDVEAH